MAISPLHSSNDATAQGLQQAKQTSQAQQTANVAAAQTKVQQSRQNTQTQHVQAPKPVVNTQGQKTGQIVNATA